MGRVGRIGEWAATVTEDGTVAIPLAGAPLNQVLLGRNQRDLDAACEAWAGAGDRRNLASPGDDGG